MKIISLIPLVALLLSGCVTTQQTTARVEYKIVDVNNGIGTRVWTDENGNKKETRITEEMRSEDIANKLSQEGWTLVEFEKYTELRNAHGGGIDARGTGITMVFSRPKQ